MNMKSLFLGIVAALSFAAPALATEANPALPPANVKIFDVAAGTLFDTNKVIIKSLDGKTSIKLELTGCELNWVTGDHFVLIQAPSGNLATTTETNFNYVYGQLKNWDNTLTVLIKAKALCVATQVD